MASPEEAGNEGDLGEAEESQGGPGEAFDCAQAGLADRRKGESNFQRADGNDIAVAQNGLLDGRAVDGQEGAGFGLANQLPSLARDPTVAGPNARLFQGQVRIGRATDLHGQAGGGESGAGFSSRQDLELDHVRANQ